jgi:hypothetical protein
MQEMGRRNPDRAASLRELLTEFRRREQVPKIQDLQDRLHAAQDHQAAIPLRSEDRAGSDNGCQVDAQASTLVILNCKGRV